MTSGEQVRPATRSSALQVLETFVPNAGRAYSGERNFDTGPGIRSNVSTLSPFVRHRLVTEEEVVSAVLARHSMKTAEKFVQEVCWRTYWKGWLELRPAVWTHYLAGVAEQNRLRLSNRHLAAQVAAAEGATTGIACFDAWAAELVETGYLHNHTRMWFASIWVYTLKLPWELGADFFMRHLLDGDPSSNTLSWRWVCGLQTAGKTYLARADNIERYTSGRFNPEGELSLYAPALTDAAPVGKPRRLTSGDDMQGRSPTALLITEEDLAPESWGVGPGNAACVIGLRTADAYPGVSAKVVAFKEAALADAVARAQSYFSCPAMVFPASRDGLASLVREQALRAGVQAFTCQTMPVGPTASLVTPLLNALETDGASVAVLRRPWDSLFWPHATHGFFRLREQIPSVLAELGVDTQPEFSF